ncbi:PAS-domain containing protein [Jannaschia sp. 2305UL9-9]|uniref:PAS-domain containing protein n=1 Tax=Jannaschia sp. 2305UL9-9 TaxID=3121638 RepID=UPI00352949D7
MAATTLVLLSLLGGMIAGLMALALVLWLAPRSQTKLRQPAPENLSEPRIFIFRNQYLVDNSENVGFLVSTPIDHLKAWDELIDSLCGMADDVPAAFEELRDTGRAFRLEGRFGNDGILIVGVRQGEDIRISVASAEMAQSSMRIDLASFKMLEEDAALLAESSDSTPTLSWVTNAEGQVIWSNATYAEVAARCMGPDASRSWPVVSLFPGQASAPPGMARRQIIDQEGQRHWYEITSLPADAQGRRHMHALSLDAVITAEDNLRTFIQTLTKTFAHLPTGLAIFDRENTLAMFNPALMDMTGLDGSWLSRRPKLADFFDALRDHRKLPEPRDYKAWRDGLSDLSRVDPGGTYRETWTLPTGQTYCVTGRPQADGAVALMLEDISADVSASQTQREEREALLTALSANDDAVIVFSRDGRCIAGNTVSILHLAEKESGALPETLGSCIDLWRQHFAPSPVWGDLRSFARADIGEAERTEWSETLHCLSGKGVSMRVLPSPGGGLTLCFSESAAETLLPQADAASAEVSMA